MRAWVAILFTAVLLAACIVVSALIYFDLTWLLVLVTSLWVAIDSSKLKLNRYKLTFSCRPVALFCLCAIYWFFWIVIFPWYLWARREIKNGNAVLKEEIPPHQPFRRFFWRLKRSTDRFGEWVLITLFVLKIIFVMFCLEECLRGHWAWENYRHQVEARGQTLDWNALIPPPVPDSKNIFSAPMMSHWFAKHPGKVSASEELSERLNYTNNAPPILVAKISVLSVGSNQNFTNPGLVLRLDDPASSRAANDQILNLAGPALFGLKGDHTFLARSSLPTQITPLQFLLPVDKRPQNHELIKFFNNRSYPNGPLIVRADGANSFQLLTSFCSASDYLRWSDQFKGDFNLIREGLMLPYAQIKGDYHLASSFPLPNLAAIRAVALTLIQRAQCYLLLSQPDKAFEELSLAHDLCRMLQNAPTGKPMPLLTCFGNIAIDGLYVDVIANGLRLQVWHEAQLATFQNQLSQADLFPSMQESIRDEQASALCVIETEIISKITIQKSPGASLWQKIRNLRPADMFHGFLDLNLLKIVELEQKAADGLDLTNRTVQPLKLAQFQTAYSKVNNNHFSPYTLLAGLVVANYTKPVQKFAFTQTMLDEAQIACALERYRLAEGNYPDSLAQLVPHFIEKIPHDIIGGQPLKYHHNGDGTFTLYSIGWNEIDDAGKSFMSDYEKGDWAWQ